MSSWLFDLFLFATLLFFALVFYRLNRISNAEESLSSAADVNLNPASKLSLFPYPRKMIRQCGIAPDEIVQLYWSAKVILACLLPLGLMEFFSTQLNVFVYIVASVGGFMTPDVWFFFRRKQRRIEIENGLRFLTEMIVALLKTGLTLAQAFEQAADYALPQQHPLALEVKLLAKELEAGRDRDDAFTKLADRTGVDSLQRMASIISVGLRSGSSIAEALESQLEVLRLKQRERVEEIVSKKSLQAMFPMILVSFPLVLVLVFFPAGVQLLEAYSLFRESMI